MLNLRLSLLILLFLPLSTLAATQSITANVGFDTPLSILVFDNLNFGTVRAGTVEEYTVDPVSGLITALNSTNNILYGFAFRFYALISGSSTQTINISTTNFVADNGVSVTATTCDYNSAGIAGSCALSAQTAPDVGTSLAIGATISVDGTQTAGETAAPTFDLVVTYN